MVEWSFGTFRYEESSEIPRDLPTSKDWSCFGCDGPAVWLHVHRLSLISFRKWGKGHTIRQCNFLCDDCEQLYASGQDQVLVDRYLAKLYGQHGLDRHESGEKPVAVFSASDLAVYVLPRNDVSPSSQA